MKHFIISALCIICFACLSCSDEKTDNYTFVSKLTITCSPTSSLYPQKATTVMEKKAITEQQAIDICSGLNYIITSSSNGYTITQKNVTTYVLTINYVPEPTSTGIRVVK